MIPRIIMAWMIMAMHKRGLCSPFHGQDNPYITCPALNTAAKLMRKVDKYADK